MNDEQVIGLMKEAALDGRDGGAADVAAAVAAGRRIRRRRRARAVTGSGMLAAVVAFGAVAAGPFGAEDRAVVVQPADDGPTSEPVGPGPESMVVEAERPYGGDSVSRESNVDLMLSVLGSDWRRQGAGQDVEVVPGSPTARSLPEFYGATVRFEAFASGLAEQCRADDDKDSRASACVASALPDGRVVQLQQRRTNLAVDPHPWDSTMAYYERSDGSFVRVEFAVYATGGPASPARQAVADAWLDARQDLIAALVADPRAQPSLDGTPPIAGPRLSPGQEALLEALGSDFKVRSGEIYFEASTKDQSAELGSPIVHASIGTITRSAFDAACGARPGPAACEQRTLPDGRMVHTRAWVDHDTATSELRGENAAYVERPGGDVVVAALTLTGTQVTTETADRYETAVRDWFDSLQDALITAAADERAAQD